MALRRLRVTVADIAEALGMGPLDSLRDPAQGRHGPARTLGARAARAQRADSPGELVHIDVKRLGRIEGGAGNRATGSGKRHYRPTFTDLDGHRRHSVGWEFVHIAVDVDSPRFGGQRVVRRLVALPLSFSEPDRVSRGP